MSRRTLIVSFLVLSIMSSVFIFKFSQAAGKPDVTRQEATYLEGAVNMHIEWQSPNPVVMVKISIGNKQQDIKVDPYDNKRNRDGYGGEVNVTIGLDWIPNQPFAYVIQIEDELRIKSALVTGKVNIPRPQYPQYPQYQQYPQYPQSPQQYPQQPGIQFQIQPNIPPAAPQTGIQPGMQPGYPLGTQPAPQTGTQPGIQPYVQPGTQPIPQPGIQPGAQPGGQQAGTIIVIIVPQIVADSGAMWRVAGGPWKRSGEEISNLPPGVHTLEFQAVAGWIKPENQSVVIEGGQTLALNGIYNK